MHHPWFMSLTRIISTLLDSMSCNALLHLIPCTAMMFTVLYVPTPLDLCHARICAVAVCFTLSRNFAIYWKCSTI